ncbi:MULTISPECIES: sugar ABC transporter substrate-binding protein [Actinomyces]|uniref:Extracellular solute-binding protein n=1 Tax=Actinomyces respiraculi TaxID=2744574 RepID=A0A7T0LMV5_9ACTO|nr:MULTISPECIES: extracellular solute-binding protein [Actinomyces]QPL06356.1 extracellular solute-binding protein [Actinomyces respiraculi]
MSLNRRSFLSFTAIAATLSAAAACSGGTDAPETATADSTEAMASDDSVMRDPDADLVIWADEKKANSLREAAITWGKAQGITVAVQVVANELQSTFITANQAGNGPDVVLGAHDWIGNLVQNNSVSPVTLSEAAKSNIVEVGINAVTYDGQMYGVPYAVETLALFVNKGLTSVTAPTTIEELVAAGQAAGTEAVLSLPVGESGDAYHMQPLYTSGGGYLFGKNADGSLNPQDVGVGAEGSLASAAKIGELGTQGVLRTSITGDNAISLFTEGKAPYLVSGPWALADIVNAGIDYTVSQIPGFEGLNTARPFAGVNAFYVASKGKNAAFAQTFVTDVVKDTTITRAMFDLNQLPPVQKDLTEELKADYPDMVTFATLASEHADPMPSIPEMSEIWGPLGKAEANIVGGSDPATTMTSAGDEIKSAIAG